MNYNFKSPYGSENYTLQVKYSKYANGQRRMQLIDCIDGLPYCTVSVSHEDIDESAGEILVKNYSENEGVLSFLLENGIVNPPHRYINSGYVKMPVCTIKDHKI